MDWKKIKEYSKKYAIYGLYVVPFVGAVIEYSKPREKRTNFGKIVADLGIVAPLIKIALIAAPYVIHKTYKENENSPKGKKENIEKIIEKDSLSFNKSKLKSDKLINYYHLSKENH